MPGCTALALGRQKVWLRRACDVSSCSHVCINHDPRERAGAAGEAADRGVMNCALRPMLVPLSNRTACTVQATAPCHAAVLPQRLGNFFPHGMQRKIAPIRSVILTHYGAVVPYCHDLGRSSALLPRSMVLCYVNTASLDLPPLQPFSYLQRPPPVGRCIHVICYTCLPAACLMLSQACRSCAAAVLHKYCIALLTDPN